MYTKLALTLTGIITVATLGIFGFSTSAYGQANSTEEPEIRRENERTNNGDNQTPSDREDETPVIIIPSYPNRTQQDRVSPSNFDQNRSQRQRDYYNRLMAPYHQRHNMDRYSDSYRSSPGTSTRDNYRRYGRYGY